MGEGTNVTVSMELNIEKKKKNRSKFVLEFWDRVRDKTCEFAASEYLYL